MAKGGRANLEKLLHKAWEWQTIRQARGIVPPPKREAKRDSSRQKLDAGWFWAAAMAIGLWIAAPKIGRVPTALGLAGMAVFMGHALWRTEFARIDSKRRIKLVLVSVISAGVLTAFGIWVWPPIKRHVLNEREREWFEKPLRTVGGDDLDIQIGCPANDERTCIYAGQFINLFGEAGWKIESSPERITLSRAQDGITVYRRGGNKQDMVHRWNSGGWFAINEGHLLAVQSAFRAIHIEINGATNPDLEENTMMIYVGPERENEAEPTSLTTDTDWATGKRKGPFPFSKP
jgi:hypothetical protein